MLLIAAYVSQSEEALLGQEVAVLLPQARCGLECVYCYLRGSRPVDDWSASRIAGWALGSGAEALEWCGWPDLGEAREVYRLLAGRMTVILKTSGADAEWLDDLLDERRPFYDVYLPDVKFGSARTAALLAGCPDYTDQSEKTLSAIGRRFPEQRFDEGGRLVGGVVARHLMLPGFLDDTLHVIDRFSECASRYGWPLSLADVYAPPRGIAAAIKMLSAIAPDKAGALKRLSEILPDEDFNRARAYAQALGIEVI
jgi:uncharacterized Fe-S radical SAM superfamily protein PflX